MERNVDPHGMQAVFEVLKVLCGAGSHAGVHRGWRETCKLAIFGGDLVRGSDENAVQMVR